MRNNITRGDFARVAFSFLIAAIVVGCGATPRQRYERSAIALGGAADAIRIAVASGYVKDPEALAAMRFGLLAARNALDKAYAYVLAGNEHDADYWLGQFDDALAVAVEQYTRTGARHADFPSDDHPGGPARP